MNSTGPAAEAARAAFRAHLDAKGHAVENAQAAAATLEAALTAGALTRTPALDRMLGDLAVALDADLDAGEKLGAKSAEAARFILRAISRELDQACRGSPQPRPDEPFGRDLTARPPSRRLRH